MSRAGWRLVRAGGWCATAAGARRRPPGELLAHLAGKLTRGPARYVPGEIGNWQPRTQGAPGSAELGYSPAGFGQHDLLKPTWLQRPRLRRDLLERDLLELNSRRVAARRARAANS
jgi:hypothetical protein